MTESPFTIARTKLADGRLLFWCFGLTPEFLAWLDRRATDVKVLHLTDREGFGWRNVVLWTFRDPRDAHWCALRFSAWEVDRFPEWHFYTWHDDDCFSSNDWWDEEQDASEEMTWERTVGSLNLGSTGGCPMWQEGPRPRPLARPRR